jgi:hypothetical protein
MVGLECDMSGSLEEYEDFVGAALLEYGLDAVPEGLAEGDGGVAATRCGALRRMTRKEQESYIAGLLDEWENRLG